MIGALIYLQLTTLKNIFRGRMMRLRQPKYFLAALVGVAYFYFFFFKPATTGPIPLQGVSHNPVAGLDWSGLLEPAGGFFLAVAVALAWILPQSRAALAFTEVEIAFLFPAPVPRRVLVHFKLIKSQFGIVFSVALLTLISNRWAFMGGNWGMHAVGWWLIFSIYNLHLLGASFARTRLLEFGVDARRRRLIVIGALGLLGVVTWFWLRRTLPPVSLNDFATPQAFLDYIEAVLVTPPLAWVLVPFRFVVRPFFAESLTDFLYAFWPGLLVLVGHYFWVVRSDVAFEEASVDLSQKRAERLTAMHAGRWTSGLPMKKRREPFVLASQGALPIAFLWKGLIAAGPLYYPKNWLVLGLVLATGTVLVGSSPDYQHFLVLISVVAGSGSVYGLFFGPVLIRRGVGQLLERLDLLKSFPVPGWQVVLGEVLCPVAILCAFEWVFLAVLALVLGFSGMDAMLTPIVVGTGAVSTALLMVPLVGLLFIFNFAGVLYFPAWLGTSGQQGGGIEKFGQRLIFFVGYLIVLVMALLPAVGLGAGLFLLVWAGTGQLALAILFGSVLAFAALAAEFAVAIRWLGRRFEQFDLSVEMPR